MHGRNEKFTQILGGKLEWTVPFKRPRHRWEVNIKMNLNETGCEGVDLLHRVFEVIRYFSVIVFNSVTDHSPKVKSDVLNELLLFITNFHKEEHISK
jgi:hypothetical protein